jgi:hypothetical protein
MSRADKEEDEIRDNIRRHAATLPVFCKRPDAHGVPPEKLASKDTPLSVYCNRCLWGGFLREFKQ